MGITYVAFFNLSQRVLVLNYVSKFRNNRLHVYYTHITQKHKINLMLLVMWSKYNVDGISVLIRNRVLFANMMGFLNGHTDNLRFILVRCV